MASTRVAIDLADSKSRRPLEAAARSDSHRKSFLKRSVLSQEHTHESAHLKRVLRPGPAGPTGCLKKNFRRTSEELPPTYTLSTVLRARRSFHQLLRAAFPLSCLVSTCSMTPASNSFFTVRRCVLTSESFGNMSVRALDMSQGVHAQVQQAKPTAFPKFEKTRVRGGESARICEPLMLSTSNAIAFGWPRRWRYVHSSHQAAASQLTARRHPGHPPCVFSRSNPRSPRRALHLA